MKNSEFSPEMRDVLGQVFVNMPWRFLRDYIDIVIDNLINVQIGFWAEDLERVSVGEVCNTIGFIRQKGSRVTVHGPFLDLCSGSLDPEIRKVTQSRLACLFELIEQIQPEQLVCHTGFDPRHHRSLRTAWLENSISMWEPFVRRAEILKMPLVLENVFEDGPDLHLELMERINSPWFGFCLDVGHQNSFSNTPLNEWLEVMWPYLKEVHLHDNDGSFDAHLPIGAGTVDFDYLFQFMGQKKISPVLNMEPHTAEHMYESVTRLAASGSFRQFIMCSTE